MDLEMSLGPAQMLERSTPAAHNKARLQESADADISVFDPTTVTDRTTFENPKQPAKERVTSWLAENLSSTKASRAERIPRSGNCGIGEVRVPRQSPIGRGSSFCSEPL